MKKLIGSSRTITVVASLACGCILGSDQERCAGSSEERSVGFATSGVARDLVVRHGLEHLEKFGAFDEVTTGRGWLNMGVLEYIYGDMPGAAATPQVIVVERTVKRDGEWGIEDQRVLARRAGLDEIEEWAKEGSPLPPEMH